MECSAVPIVDGGARLAQLATADWRRRRAVLPIFVCAALALEKRAMGGCTRSLGRHAAVIGITILAAGCSTRALIAKFVPGATDHFARAFIDTLASQPVRATVHLLIPQLAMNDAAADSLAMLQRLLPEGHPDSIEIASVVVRSEDGYIQRTLEYQVHGHGKWALIRLVVNENYDDNGPRVAGLRVWPLPASLESLNRLTLTNASPVGVIAAALALILVGFSVFAAIQVVRSPLKQRWLWVIVALLGFGRFSIPWKNGSIVEQWLAVQLFSAGMQRQGFLGPWWIFLSLPGGAVIALDRRRRAIAAGAKFGMSGSASSPETTEPSSGLPGSSLPEEGPARLEP